jgi:Flagellar basal body rod FlgEFG protein C-terminal
MVGLDTALQGLSRSLDSFSHAADRIAQFPASVDPQQDQVSISDEMVALTAARNGYQAKLNIIRTAEELDRALLDILA